MKIGKGKLIIGSLLICIFLMFLPTVMAGVTTGGSEEQGGLGIGDPWVELYPKIEGDQCVGARAIGTFPFKLFPRTMKVKIRWDAYDTDEHHYADSFTGSTINSMGRWTIERWVKIIDFDYGDFWGYCYENGVLKDTDHEYYTHATST